MDGRVVRFDAHKGYGFVRSADGEELFFHCTAITDGSRTVEVGTEVEFERVAGHSGRYEAIKLSPRS